MFTFLCLEKLSLKTKVCGGQLNKPSCCHVNSFQSQCSHPFKEHPEDLTERDPAVCKSTHLLLNSGEWHQFDIIHQFDNRARSSLFLILKLLNDSYISLVIGTFWQITNSYRTDFCFVLEQTAVHATTRLFRTFRTYLYSQCHRNYLVINYLKNQLYLDKLYK